MLNVGHFLSIYLHVSDIYPIFATETKKWGLDVGIYK